MKQEFQLRNYRLDHPDISVFTTSPWCSPLFLILYRSIIALYTTLWTILGGLARLEAGPKWFIFLTNWSYTFLNVHFIVGTLLPAYYHYVYTKRKVVACDSNANEQPLEIELQQAENPTDSTTDKPDIKLRHPRMLIITCKASWVLCTIAANVAPLVTALYWAFDYVPGQYLDASNVNAHAVNSVLMIIDIMVCNIPVRIFHVVYPMMYGLIYTIFTIVYWAVGGRNHKNKKYIYAILDYEKNAGLAVLMAAMFVLVAVPISQFLLYGLYRFRVWLVTKRQLTRNEPQKM